MVVISVCPRLALAAEVGMPRWPTQTLEHRFWSKVRTSDPSDCWLWLGSTNGQYGVFPEMRPSGKWGNSLAHRVSWRVTRGTIPNGLYVCHKCDIRLCVNPAHLWLGTHRENQADMGRKGRTYSPAKKLTDDDVTQIRLRIERGEPRISIASAFNVAPNHISRIKSGARRSPRS